MSNLPLDEVKTLAVGQGLIFIHEGATPEWGAETFSLYYGRTCLHRTSDIATVEHYLWGFRDGRTLRVPEASNVLVSAQTIRELAKELTEFIEPLTRERG